jgi:replication-associated recombination protein RarA
VPAAAADLSPFCPADLTETVIRREFADVYQREAHLRLINDSIRLAVETDWNVRVHTLLYGPPGGCKTTLFEKLKTLFEQGEEVERVGFIDMTAATKAGLETWILSQAEEKLLPEILVLEEIEKCDKDNLMALGSIMASGYIMRTNARISRVRHEVKSLIWARRTPESAEFGTR